MERSPLRTRLRAVAIHLAVSLAVAALAAVLVFGLWFPGDYRYVSGGTKLFALVAIVDLALGPLLTLAVFDVQKSRRHLATDLSVIGLIQLAALVYGLASVFQARPVALVFETDRLRVVAAVQVELAELYQAAPDYRRLPVTGPWLLGARLPAPGGESNDALFKALQGIDRAQRPKFWRPYAELKPAALERARPLSVLFEHYPAVRKTVATRLESLRIDVARATFLPLIGHQGDWVAVLDDDGGPVLFVPVDGFF